MKKLLVLVILTQSLNFSLESHRDLKKSHVNIIVGESLSLSLVSDQDLKTTTVCTRVMVSLPPAA